MLALGFDVLTRARHHYARRGAVFLPAIREALGSPVSDVQPISCVGRKARLLHGNRLAPNFALTGFDQGVEYDDMLVVLVCRQLTRKAPPRLNILSSATASPARANTRGRLSQKSVAKAFCSDAHSRHVDRLCWRLGRRPGSAASAHRIEGSRLSPNLRGERIRHQARSS